MQANLRMIGRLIQQYKMNNDGKEPTIDDLKDISSMAFPDPSATDDETVT